MRDFKDKNIDKLQRDVRRLTFIPKGKTTIINNTEAASLPEQLLLGKPIVTGAIPKNLQTLVYNEKAKQWEPSREYDTIDLIYTGDSVTEINLYRDGILGKRVLLTYAGDKVTEIEIWHSTGSTELIELNYTGDNVTQIIKEVT